MRMDRKEFNKYCKDYIVGVDIDNIEFKVFTYNELLDFFRTYYYDDEFNKFVYWEPDGFMSPFGMYYLEFETYSKDLSYLLGVVDNLKGGKTIAFCMVYDNNYGPIDEIENKVGYIFTVETNYFFRNKGVLKKSLKYIKDVFKNDDILVISPESLKGSEITISKRIEELFDGRPIVMNEEEYFNSLARRQKW